MSFNEIIESGSRSEVMATSLFPARSKSVMNENPEKTAAHEAPQRCEHDAVTEQRCERPDRRAVLEKLGTLAAYTPPIMLGMMVSRGVKADEFGSNPDSPG